MQPSFAAELHTVHVWPCFYTRDNCNMAPTAMLLYRPMLCCAMLPCAVSCCAELRCSVPTMSMQACGWKCAKKRPILM